EIRIPNSEGRKKSENRRPNKSAARDREFRISGFGLPSDFDVRISDLIPRRLHGQGGKRDEFVRLAEIIGRPFVRKEHHGIFAHVVSEPCTGGQRERVEFVLSNAGRQPARNGPW